MQFVRGFFGFGGSSGGAADDGDDDEPPTPRAIPLAVLRRLASSGGGGGAVDPPSAPPRSAAVEAVLLRATTERTAEALRTAVANAQPGDEETLHQALERIIALAEEQGGEDVQMTEEIRLTLQNAYARNPFADAELFESLLFDMPGNFLGRITYDVMSDPVMCSDGQTYERAAIVKWFNDGHTTSPITREELETLPSGELRMTPNVGLRGVIAEWEWGRGLIVENPRAAQVGLGRHAGKVYTSTMR